MTDALAKFQQVISQRHDYAQQWKARTGGKVVGVLCTYVPEEIIYAAGMLPVRVLGSHEPQDVTESHIFSMFCAYCRDVLAQGLLGRYPYLDGLVFAHCCPHIRQTFESWRRYIPLEFSYLFWVPYLPESPHADAYFLAGVRGLKEGIEGWRGISLSPDKLRQATEVYNLNRRLLTQIYQLRKQDPPAISGTAAMEMVLASSLMDKEEHNALLQELMAHPRQPEGEGVRLIVLGSENDDVEVIRFMESSGAVVVMEDNCVGNRYFWDEVSPDGDPLTALATRYLGKPPCPLRDLGRRRRADYILELAKEYKAQGAIFLRQKFCDPHAWEIPVIQNIFQEQGLPGLVLELDVTIPLGQYRTRLEAFLEMFL